MSDGTKIEWTDATVNVINGCTVVSPGCTNCYAMKQAHRFDVRRGLTRKTNGGMVWTGEVRFSEKALLQPLHWKRPRRIFWNAHGDTFHENVPDEWIDRCFAVMALTPHHTHQVLTKRPERMRDYFAETWQPAPAHVVELEHFGAGPDIQVPAETRGEDRWDQINRAIDDITQDPLFDQDRFWTSQGSLIGRPAWPRQPLPNVWLGVSVEDQKRADERIPLLLDTPAAVRWLSCEPLLGPVDLRHVKCAPDPHVEADWTFDSLMKSSCYEYWDGQFWMDGDGPPREAAIDWVVVGGESGPGARPMHPDWARSIHDQCAAAGVPFHFKQWGEYSADQIGPEDARSIHYPPGHVIFNKVGKKAAGRKLFGVEHNGWPL